MHSSSRSAVSARGGFLGLPVAHQLDAEHQPHAPDLADQRLALLELQEPVLEVAADRQGVLLDALAVDDLERRQPLGHRDRVAAERVEVDPVLHDAGDLRPRDARAQRRPVADPLGHGDQVGRDAPVLEAPEGRAGPAEAGLDLVGDAQAAVLADDLVDDLEVLAEAA